MGTSRKTAFLSPSFHGEYEPDFPGPLASSCKSIVKVNGGKPPLKGHQEELASDPAMSITEQIVDARPQQERCFLSFAGFAYGFAIACMSHTAILCYS